MVNFKRLILLLLLVTYGCEKDTVFTTDYTEEGLPLLNTKSVQGCDGNFESTIIGLSNDSLYGKAYTMLYLHPEDSIKIYKLTICLNALNNVTFSPHILKIQYERNGKNEYLGKWVDADIETLTFVFTPLLNVSSDIYMIKLFIDNDGDSLPDLDTTGNHTAKFVFRYDSSYSYSKIYMQTIKEYSGIIDTVDFHSHFILWGQL
ncbi:MAG: hypothetical protein WC614_12645 [bacterium]